MMPYRLYDMHCHLSQMANAEDVAREAAAAGVAVFDCGVEPRGLTLQREHLAPFDNVVVGMGLHPWWLEEGRYGEHDIVELCAIAQQERFIGEVGLDFSRKHAGSRGLQTHAFEALSATLAAHPLEGRVLSVHAVQSAGTVLDILEAHGLVDDTAMDGNDRGNTGGLGTAAGASCSPAVVFHWFSGRGDELTRARKLGCYFSVNEMMLGTRRGRAYAKQIPEDCLLLETDAPPVLGKTYSAEILTKQLERTLATLADIRGVPQDALARHITRTSTALLNIG